MDTLWHLAEPEQWTRALATGTYTGSTKGQSLADVGFVHCSFEAQLPLVAAAIYAGSPQLVLLEIDPQALADAGVRVLVEPVAGSEERFPHAYGPIPTAAVTSVTPMLVDQHGTIHRPPTPPAAQ